MKKAKAQPKFNPGLEVFIEEQRILGRLQEAHAQLMVMYQLFGKVRDAAREKKKDATFSGEEVDSFAWVLADVAGKVYDAQTRFSELSGALAS